MKILLLGSSGQVGWELQRSLSVLGELFAPGRDEADLAHAESLTRVVRTLQPDVIVNAAAHTAVDKAESEPELAHAINAIAPEVLAREAHRLDAWLLHYSTDYVFDGSGSRPWREDDTPAPLSVYGHSKLAGERHVATHLPRHLILRTSWVYAARGQNFAKTMLRLAAERERLTVIDDQFGAPTGAELLADVSAHLLRAVLADGDARRAGLYHLAAAGETTWNGYARFVLGEAQRLGVPLKAGPEQVDPVPSSAFATAARRPHNSRLDTARLSSTFGLQLPPWQQGVRRMLEEHTGS